MSTQKIYKCTGQMRLLLSDDVGKFIEHIERDDDSYAALNMLVYKLSRRASSIIQPREEHVCIRKNTWLISGHNTSHIADGESRAQPLEILLPLSLIPP